MTPRVPRPDQDQLDAEQAMDALVDAGDRVADLFDDFEAAASAAAFVLAHHVTFSSSPAKAKMPTLSAPDDDDDEVAYGQNKLQRPFVIPTSSRRG